MRRRIALDMQGAPRATRAAVLSGISSRWLLMIVTMEATQR